MGVLTFHPRRLDHLTTVSPRVYYFFYERTREAILASPSHRSKALSTLESMFAGLIAGMSGFSHLPRALFIAAAGTATTVVSNPIWVTQVTQATQTLPSETSAQSTTQSRKLSMIETIRFILRKDGLGAFWRGIGPALVLVVNPILQVAETHDMLAINTD